MEVQEIAEALTTIAAEKPAERIKPKYPHIEFTSFMVTRPLGKNMYTELEQALIPLREFASTLPDVRFNYEAFSTWRPEGRAGNCKTNVYLARLTENAPSLNDIESKLKTMGYRYFKRSQVL